MLTKMMLALALAGAPAEESPEMQEAQALYSEGTAMFDSADYNGAVEKFTKALAIVQSVEGDDHTRLSLLYNIASAHEKAHAIDKDVTHLRQALQLYERYRAFAQETGNLGDELDVETKIARLENQLRAADQIQRNREEAERREVPPPPPPVQEADWKKPRNTGVGLVVGGSVATIGGVVLAVVGSTREAKARDQVDELADLDVPMDDPAWAEGDQFIADEKRKGNALMGVGATLAVVGAAGVGVGAYYLVKAKKMREGRVSALPALAPGYAGVQITGRF